MSDSWCTKVMAKNGVMVFGGAARNVRIADCGGMDEIIKAVASRAAEDALKMANKAVTKNRREEIKRVK